MRRFKGADELRSRIKRQCALVAKILNLAERFEARRPADRMLRRVGLKPFFFEGNQFELIRAGEQGIELRLIDQIAEASLRRRAFDQFLIPRLRQIAQLFRANVANIDLVRCVSRRRGKVAQKSS